MSDGVHGATLLGIDARPVEVEVRLLRGQMGRFLLTGLPGAAVRESRDRVKAAIQAAGFEFPRQSILVHLAPSDLRKDGPLLDLPIALGVLLASEQLELVRQGPLLAAGELALDGRVREVRGALPIADAARRQRFRTLLLPPGAARLAGLAVGDAATGGLDALAVARLVDAASYLAGRTELEPVRAIEEDQEPREDPTLLDVRGQEEAKRALEAAAAGMHNLLLVGPPGAGKTMLARRVRSLLPDLDAEQALECARIRSVVEPELRCFSRRPPFRAPHHTSSPVALVGGGPTMRPGEITLAHHGVLFLDEFPEFPRNAIEALRQPLEEQVIQVARIAGSATFPAAICLVAAMNPCPCGYRGHPKLPCRCTESAVHRYTQRISGPVLDRIDLTVEVPPLRVDDLFDRHAAAGRSRDPAGRPAAETAEAAEGDRRGRIAAARRLQRRRFAGSSCRFNSHMDRRLVERHCGLDEPCRELLLAEARRLGFSARAVTRTLRVARTFADLEQRAGIARADLARALAFRNVAVCGA